MNIQDQLANNSLFAQLTSEQLERVKKSSVRKTLQSGECLFEQGDIAHRFFYIVSGKIKLFRATPSGSEKIIEVITSGSTFAEALMFLDRPLYPVGGEALTPVEVISIDSQDFASMLRDSMDTCFLLMGDMSQRLRGLLREIDELSQYSAISRFASYLMQIAPEGEGVFELPVTKQILASRLSVKPETLSRIIKRLVQSGIITIHGNHIEILDSVALDNIADTCANPRDHLRITFGNQK